MNNPTVPPRFVPTLTEVVLPIAIGPDGAMGAGPGTVVEAAIAAEQGVIDQAPVPADNTPLAVISNSASEEQLIQRALQRVDMLLERRLREALGQLISEHIQALVPRLREEIEGVVRDSVNEAFSQDSSSM